VSLLILLQDYRTFYTSSS